MEERAEEAQLLFSGPGRVLPLTLRWQDPVTWPRLP